MSQTVFGVVIFAAALHAAWNAIVKAGKDKTLTMVCVTASAAIWAAVLLPTFSSSKMESWPFIAGSATLQIGYFALVAKIYRIPDFGRSYPLMRGAAPIIVALAGVVMLGESPNSNAWVGIFVISSGILIMMLGGRKDNPDGLALARLNAVIIAGYTLVDGVGVRLSGSPVAYTLWIFLLTGVTISLWAILTRRTDTHTCTCV